MRLTDAFIPLGFAWSSTFVRWQGSLAEISGLDLAVAVTGRALEDRGLSPGEVGQLVLGWTVPQQGSFYGAPTVAARLGAERVTGPMISQACATSVACVQAAALTAAADPAALTLVVTTDRTSNGPHIVYPSPSSAGGAPASEDWVLDNFRRDPWAERAPVQTAEAVAAEGGFTREQVDEVTLLRHEQYRQGRKHHSDWLVPVTLPRRRGSGVVVDADDGVYPTTAEKLAKLDPSEPGGVVTFGSQTHPADGAAGAVVTGKRRARELAGGTGVVRLLSAGVARVGKGLMPKAPVPAAQAALADAGLGIDDVDAVTTHNPFAVNDLWFSRQTGYPVERMNPLGSSLVYGHPQAPTGARLIAELIQVLHHRGGGVGLFTGCAAGDTGAALVLRVED